MKQQKSQSGFAHLMLITVILGLAVVGLLGYVLWQNFMQDKSTNNSKGGSTISAPKNSDGDDNKPASTKLGTIEGSTRYPSDMPEYGAVVYAINISNGKEYKTSERTQDTYDIYKEGFKLEVPAGEYYVYGMTTREGSGKAYYDDYAVCVNSDDFVNNPSSDNCEMKDNTKIVVTVEEGKSTTGVIAGNWWYQQ